MIRLASILFIFAAARAMAQDTINWASEPNAVNLTSAGVPMDAGFRFELGVFQGAFVPTVANLTQWSANWKAAQRTGYNTERSRFADSFALADNAAPFTVGKAAFVWGFRCDAQASEWILFRANPWNWPSAASFPPAFFQWNAKDAVAVIGAIHPSGSPFLMKSAPVAGVSPPVTTWAQWRAENLSGVVENGAGQDPDRDGTSNLLEFVFGTNPMKPGHASLLPVSLIDVGEQRHAAITVPRRIDHLAILKVEVSSDLTTWLADTVIVENFPGALLVRDAVPLDPANPKRFLRLKAQIP